jgi:ribonuclease BN (tRNA processing enzyme)
VQGLPFFGAGDRATSVVDLYLPAQGDQSAEELLARLMSPPLFPIGPRGLKGRWSFHSLEAEERAIAGFRVRSAELTHKGGRTFGYRVTDGTGSVAYLPDHSPAQGCTDDVRALVRGVDVLLHDAQFVERERAIADDYGHATIDDAIRLADECDVGTLVLFHHSPVRTDDQLDAIAAELRAPMPVRLAREGDVLDVPNCVDLSRSARPRS